MTWNARIVGAHFSRNRLLKVIASFMIVLLIYLYFTKATDLFAESSEFLNKVLSLVKQNTPSTEQQFELKSDCECRRNQRVFVSINASTVLVYIGNRSTIQKNVLKMNRHEFMRRTFTCDPYNVLRRGGNQKVISFSLYGPNGFYYHQIKHVVKQLKKIHPDWLIRIYYDSTTKESLPCEVECLLDDSNSSFVDNTDFCDMNHLYFNFKDYISGKFLNANYTHKRHWRWLFYLFLMIV
jgi:hypothetical protein